MTGIYQSFGGNSRSSGGNSKYYKYNFFGTGTALYTIRHNLNSKDLFFQVLIDGIYVDGSNALFFMPDNNRVAISFTPALPTGTPAILLIGQVTVENMTP